MTPFTRHTRKNAYARKRGPAVAVISSTRMRVAAIAALMIAMAMYVVQVNAVSVKGFTIFEVEQSITSLERENQRLELHVAQLQSASTIKQHITQLGMTGEGETEYITVEAEEVAIR